MDPEPLQEKHYSLIKVLIDNLLAFLERGGTGLETEDLISTKMLGSKNCLRDLKDSSIYAFTKVATARKTVDVAKDFKDIINAFKLLYSFSVTKRFRGVVFRAVRSYFTNPKHNNTFEQVLGPYCLKFMD